MIRTILNKMMLEVTEMINTIFIILHYKFYKLTSSCIQSLLKLDLINECKIIVFDNGSDNGSYERLEHVYKENPLIILCKNGSNLGFSEGNNMAYSIAQRYSPQFIIALNNDVVIRQRNFIKQVNEIYKEENFHILGPDIFAPYQKEHQSPLYPTFPTDEQLKKRKQVHINILQNLDIAIKREVLNRKKSIVRRYIPMMLLNVFRQIKKRGYLFNKKSDNYKQIYRGCVLQGSCLIFSKRYIAENEKLFEPTTKFYLEEYLLTLKCRTLEYSIIYNPKIQIIHYHEVSTRKSAASIKDYLIQHSQNMLDAFEILEKTLKENPWQINH